MTQTAQVTQEFPTANGAYRAARIAFVHALWHREIVEERAHLASSLKKGRDTVPLPTMVEGEEE